MFYILVALAASLFHVSAGLSCWDCGFAGGQPAPAANPKCDPAVAPLNYVTNCSTSCLAYKTSSAGIITGTIYGCAAALPTTLTPAACAVWTGLTTAAPTVSTAAPAGAVTTLSPTTAAPAAAAAGPTVAPVVTPITCTPVALCSSNFCTFDAPAPAGNFPAFANATFIASLSASGNSSSGGAATTAAPAPSSATSDFIRAGSTMAILVFALAAVEKRSVS